MENILCDRCGTQIAMHTISYNGITELCCRCYVELGNPPADWHKGCMKVAKEMEEKNQNK